MDNKEIIITRAHKLLMSMGPTAMTMDMVARECGISKRTLYETFGDKRTLVMECIAMEQALRNQEACKIYNEASNCFEALFAIFTNLRRYLSKRSHSLVEDVIRLYPEVKRGHQENEKVFIKQLGNVLAKAQDEGLVLSVINTEVASFLFISQMRTLHNNASIEELGFEPIKVFEAAFINFLRGIATIKGINFIDDAVNDFFKQN